MARRVHLYSTMIFMPPLVVYASRYANATLSLTNPTASTISGLRAVGISRHLPRWPLPYELRGALLDLAPSIGLLRRAREENGRELFIEEYVLRLQSLGVEEIVRQLACAQGSAPAVVLLCFEDIRDGTRWCHRSLLARWLRDNAGLDVQELPDDSPMARTKKSKPDPRQGSLS